MRKLCFLFTAFLLTLGINSYAQQGPTVKGSVQDETGKALAGVSVAVLYATDSTLLKADVSNADGVFEIVLNRPGKFLVSYTMLGFEKTYSPIFELTAGQSFTVATAMLTPTATKLRDVTVTSRKPMIEVKADKMIFNVENSINATGSNALELLQKSPGVQVDNNENITMKGKTGVKIYIDGKMTQLDTKDLAAYLKGINSNDIEAIEMISNPSAKYDASGNAGVINIRLKKNKKFGTNGSVTAGFIQGVTPKGNASVNLNYRDKSVNVFGNVSGHKGMYENGIDLNRTQKDSTYDQHSINHGNNKSFNAKVGADLFINSKNTLGIMLTTSQYEGTWTNDSRTDVYYKPTNSYVKTLQAFNTVPNSRNNSNVNINYRYVDTSGKEINFDGDYGFFRGRSRSFQPNYYADAHGNPLYQVINRNNTPTDIDIYTAKLDVEQPKWGGKLGYGVKFSYVTTRNAFEFFNDINNVPVKQLGRSNRFAYTENVNAGYVNFNRQLSTKWSLQAGLRAEQTNSEGDLTRDDGIVQSDNNVKRHYFDLFPSAALTWNISDKHSLNLTYSRRIDRPTYQDLNPFENKLDELTYEKGNAFLRPQYTNNIELTHTFLSMINTTVGYSYVKDYATQITDTTDNATYLQQRNLANQQILSFTVGAQLPIAKWWKGYANLWYNYEMFEGMIGEKKVNREIGIFGAYMQNTFTLGNDYAMELSGWYNGPSIFAATWKTSGQGAIDLGLQKQLLQKKATLKISATDIFRTSPWTAKSDFGGLVLKAGGFWESRSFRINFTYRFGNNQVKSARDRKTGLESEAKRIKG